MFKAISDTAAAADGGSLLLLVERTDGMIEDFFLDLSFTSRGTDAYNRVSSGLRELSPADCIAVAAALEDLLPETRVAREYGEEIANQAAKFIDALRAQGQQADLGG